MTYRSDYEKENSEMIQNLFQQTFFDAWTKPRDVEDQTYRGVEFIVSSECNLGCKYCYMSRNEDKLYPKEIRSKERIVKNEGIVLDWMIENGYTPTLDFFSGSPLSSRVGLDSLWMIYDKYKDVPLEKRIPRIIIPTNYTWLISKELTAEIEDLLDKLNSIGIKPILSASVDGKYMEQNRPFKKKDLMDYDDGVFFPDEDFRDDDFYNKVFQWNLKYNYGFHPMLYSSGADKWKENFNWYQDMLAKYDMPWDSLYILEVRNVEWSTEQTGHYLDFVEFLMRWIWEEKALKNKKAFVGFLINKRPFNLLTNSLFTKSRGTTCGLQMRIYIRLGDLAIVPCHRQAYEGYEYGRFAVEDDKITGIEALNTEMALAMSTFDTKTQPYCSDCMIREICMGGCMGSQLEVNGDPFVPIPSVCDLVHKKLMKIVGLLVEFGAYEELLSRVNPKNQSALEYIHDEFRRTSQ